METIFGAPQFYVQGPGILGNTASYVKKLGLGKNVLVIVDAGVVEPIQPLFESLAKEGIPCRRVIFEGAITLDQIGALAVAERGKDYDVVLGVGGGKAIDVSKRIGWALGIPFITIATSVATDAATSRTAVAYGSKNEIIEDKTLYNPAGVLVDTSLVVKAPIRLFRSGMADAVSKRYEYLLSLKCGAPNWYDSGSVFFIDGISQEMHIFLLRNGRYLLGCFNRGEVNETVERGVMAMLLMSRLVWDPGGLRGAHDMFEEFHDAGYGNETLHGEIVGFFDLVQLLIENYPQNEFGELYCFYRDLGIPLKISTMGFPINNETALDNLVVRLSRKCARFNWHPGDKAFKKAILTLEAL
jgi:glycerol dehydrogenase